MTYRATILFAAFFLTFATRSAMAEQEGLGAPATAARFNADAANHPPGD